MLQGKTTSRCKAETKLRRHLHAWLRSPFVYLYGLNHCLISAFHWGQGRMLCFFCTFRERMKLEVSNRPTIAGPMHFYLRKSHSSKSKPFQISEPMWGVSARLCQNFGMKRGLHRSHYRLSDLSLECGFGQTFTSHRASINERLMDCLLRLQMLLALISQAIQERVNAHAYSKATPSER